MLFPELELLRTQGALAGSAQNDCAVQSKLKGLFGAEVRKRMHQIMASKAKRALFSSLLSALLSFLSVRLHSVALSFSSLSLHYFVCFAFSSLPFTLFSSLPVATLCFLLYPAALHSSLLQTSNINIIYIQ